MTAIIVFALSFLGILAFLVLLFAIEKVFYAVFPEKDDR